MERTGLFALVGRGLRLVRADGKLFAFGLVVGGLSVVQVGFMDRAMVDLTPDTAEAEVAAVLGDLALMSLVFGFLYVFAYAALWTYAVRAVQGSPSAEDTIDRVRRRVWAILFFSPVLMFVLFLPVIPLSIVAAVAGPTNLFFLVLMAAWLVALVVIIVGSWTVVPAYTISDVRFWQMFRVVWAGVRNGGLRAAGVFAAYAAASSMISVVVDLAFPDASPFGVLTVLQIPLFGFLSAWLAASIAYLWIDEAENIVVGLPSTSGDKIVASTVVYSDPAT